MLVRQDQAKCMTIPRDKKDPPPPFFFILDKIHNRCAGLQNYIEEHKAKLCRYRVNITFSIEP